MAAVPQHEMGALIEEIVKLCQQEAIEMQEKAMAYLFFEEDGTEIFRVGDAGPGDMFFKVGVQKVAVLRRDGNTRNLVQTSPPRTVGCILPGLMLFGYQRGIFMKGAFAIDYTSKDGQSKRLYCSAAGSPNPQQDFEIMRNALKAEPKLQHIPMADWEEGTLWKASP
ncbi:unnamed protein product [Symbiodinium natans]|uniref:Uncharacterized protein n=1 Tax=Symbiodinium natans TaxID=878477 RepID=A0A812PM49_9DINO|nr:unnamed protein product [Symbiodinium natans]